MIQKINFNGFIDTVGGYGRVEQLGGYNGLRALYDYIQEMEADIGQPIELDVIGLCCEWSCYETAVEAADELLVPTVLDALPEDDEAAALAALERETTVLTFDGGILVREF